MVHNFILQVVFFKKLWIKPITFWLHYFKYINKKSFSFKKCDLKKFLHLAHYISIA